MAYIKAIALLQLLAVGSIVAQDPSPTGPTFPGTVKNCNAWHTIVSGDSCWSVETKYGISHAQFIQWNPDVSDDCGTNFWATYSYCVGVGVVKTSTTTSRSTSRTTSRATQTSGTVAPPGPTQPGTTRKCNGWHIVKTGDSCWSIETKYAITHAQFIQWNPAVSDDCVTNFWGDFAYCVSIDPNAPDTPLSTSSSRSSTSKPIVTSSVNATYSIRFPTVTHNITTPTIGMEWPPKETQPGQPRDCNLWHLAGPADNCHTLVIRYTDLTMPTLLEWNPEIHDDCSGMYVNWWYCVGTKPRSSLTLTYFPPTTEVVVPDPTEFTPPPPSPTVPQPITPTPIQSGMVRDCDAFHQASSGQNCAQLLQTYTMISRAQFFAWNPALGSNCNALLAGYWYCVADFASMTIPMPSTTSALPTPVQGGYHKDCKAWYQIGKAPLTCDLIVAVFGTFSEEQFIAWNPVDDHCILAAEAYYCVGIPGTPTTRTAPLSLPVFPTEPPKQPGVASDCSRFWQVTVTDTCDKIIKANSISLVNFLFWNPAIGQTTCDNLKPDFHVCVAVGGSGTISSSRSSTAIATSTRSNSTPSGTSTSGTRATSSSRITSSSRTTSSTRITSSTSSSPPAISTPQPYQPGMVSGCVRFYYVKPGDGCWAIANANGIDLNDFYKWNPGVGPDCTTMWADAYVCIGVSGPATTIRPG